MTLSFAPKRSLENQCVLYNYLTYVYLALLPQHWALYAKVDSTPTYKKKYIYIYIDLFMYIYIYIYLINYIFKYISINIYLYIYIYIFVYIYIYIYIYKFCVPATQKNDFWVIVLNSNFAYRFYFVEVITNTLVMWLSFAGVLRKESKTIYQCKIYGMHYSAKIISFWWKS